MILLKESIDRYYYIGKYVIHYLYISSIIVVFWIEILLWTLISAIGKQLQLSAAGVTTFESHDEFQFMKGSQSWRILHGPFSMIVNSYWFTKLTLRSLIAILYRAATFHVNLSKLLAPQMRVTSDISFLFPPNPSLWLFILDACRVYAERVKIHRCAAKANVRPKTSQCSNILYTHGNQTFLTYLCQISRGLSFFGFIGIFGFKRN